MADYETKEVVIRFRIPTSPRKRWLAGLVVLVVGVSVVAYATDFTPFGSGEALSSSKMNANFQDLQSRIAALETASPALPVFKCAADNNGALFDGNLGGYLGAAQICQAACASSSPTMHMCHADELIRSVEQNISITFGTTTSAVGGWYSLGNWATYTSSGTLENDCTAWTSNAATPNAGLVWTSNHESTGTGPDLNDCSSKAALMCCDFP